MVLPPGPGQAAGRQLLGGATPARALPPSCLHLVAGGELKGVALMFAHRGCMSEGPVYFLEFLQVCFISLFQYNNIKDF